MQGMVVNGKFVLQMKLAAGAFGEIWQAQNNQTSETVAIKLEPVDAKPP